MASPEPASAVSASSAAGASASSFTSSGALSASAAGSDLLSLPPFPEPQPDNTAASIEAVSKILNSFLFMNVLLP